jgi:hypothetical protein
VQTKKFWTEQEIPKTYHSTSIATLKKLTWMALPVHYVIALVSALEIIGAGAASHKHICVAQPEID